MLLYTLCDYKQFFLQPSRKRTVFDQKLDISIALLPEFSVVCQTLFEQKIDRFLNFLSWEVGTVFAAVYWECIDAYDRVLFDRFIPSSDRLRLQRICFTNRLRLIVSFERKKVSLVFFWEIDLFVCFHHTS